MSLWTEICACLGIIFLIYWWTNYISKLGKYYRSLQAPPGLPVLGHVTELQNSEKILGVLLDYLKYGDVIRLDLGPIEKLILVSDYKLLEMILSSSKLIKKSREYKFLHRWLGTGLLTSEELLGVLLEYVKYGDILRVDVGPFEKVILVSDYKLLELILSSPKMIKKSKEYNFLHRWLGTGLLTSEALKWKKHRRIITPAFHFQILEQFIEVFEACGEVLLKKLSRSLGSSVDIYPFITLCTLDIICETAMGTNVNAQNLEDSDYVKSVKEMCRILLTRSVSAIERYDMFYKFTKDSRIEKDSLEILHGYSMSVIKQRQQEKMLKTTKNDESSDLGIKKRQAFLDVLLDATIDGRPLTLEEIREEVDTFMFEGHDTTASGISFALYCLANNPEVQKEAVREQIEIFGSLENCDVTYTDLMNMKYLEQVIKETLRLYPSVPFYGRTNEEDLEFGDTVIPKGVTFLLFAYGIQRDPRYFTDPNKFNPDRFNDIDGKQPYAYIPFSAGPRNCIGQKFAMLEMKSTISKIIRKFELLPSVPAHNVIPTPETVLKSANGIRIGIKLRE